MDPNQLLAQQMERQQTMLYGGLVLYIVMFIVSCFVVYLFYARLRDIADELRKFRIAYEFSDARQNRSTPPSGQSSQSAWPDAPKPLVPSPEDAKYLPRP
jgi:hypothetical protein